MIIGITGGSGCGKTTALKTFESLGGTVLDCDAVYHELLKTDTAMLRAIEDRFPGTVEQGSLNRQKLAAIVFSDKNALLDLNEITHSAVKQKVGQVLSQTDGHVAIDAIGLFEGGLAELCDTTVAVTAPREDRIERLMRRDGLTREQILQRLDAQRSQEEFISLCDHHLSNDSTPEAFRIKCLAFWQGLDIIQ